MNAQQAKQQTLEVIGNSISEHYRNSKKKIAEAVSWGHFSTCYNDNYNNIAYRELKKLLNQEGYKTNLYSHDYDDGIEIYWR